MNILNATARFEVAVKVRIPTIRNEILDTDMDLARQYAREFLEDYLDGTGLKVGRSAGMVRTWRYGMADGAETSEDRNPYCFLTQQDDWFYWTKCRLAGGLTARQATTNVQFRKGGWKLLAGMKYGGWSLPTPSGTVLIHGGIEIGGEWNMMAKRLCGSLEEAQQRAIAFVRESGYEFVEEPDGEFMCRKSWPELRHRWSGRAHESFMTANQWRDGYLAVVNIAPYGKGWVSVSSTEIAAHRSVRDF